MVEAKEVGSTVEAMEGVANAVGAKEEVAMKVRRAAVVRGVTKVEAMRVEAMRVEAMRVEAARATFRRP